MPAPWFRLDFEREIWALWLWNPIVPALTMYGVCEKGDRDGVSRR